MYKVLFEDEWLLVIDKPSGVATQSTVDKARPNVYDELKKTEKYVALHHRLDVPTSGVLLLSKSKEANKPITEMFRQHKFQKIYLCLCKGLPDPLFTVDNFLKMYKTPKAKMKSVHSGGDRAITEFSVLQRYAKAALLEARPKTGRMHQIRVHLSELGHTLLGDALYGRPIPGISRLMLHAQKMSFDHPVTGKPLEIISEVPEDMKTIIKQLEADSLKI